MSGDATSEKTLSALSNVYTVHTLTKLYNTSPLIENRKLDSDYQSSVHNNLEVGNHPQHYLFKLVIESQAVPNFP